MSTTKQRPGWTPGTLREQRDEHGLSLEAAGDKLRQVAGRAGLNIAANVQTLWGHENGTIYPGPHYRRAYCLLYQSTEPELGFRRPLPDEHTGGLDLPLPTLKTNSATTDEAAEAITKGLDQVADKTQEGDDEAGQALVSRVVNAWRGRAFTDTLDTTTLVLVGGYAGSGKTEFARFLADVSGWALIDKDTITRRMTERLLTELGADPHDRHSEVYLKEVRPLEYISMMDAAAENLDVGTSTILAAPFISELNDDSWMRRLVNRCAGKRVEVSALWVRCDEESMREYIEFRDAPRDAWKLANWDAYASGLNTRQAPPGAHVTIDNRHGAAITIADQTREAIRKILG